MIDSPLCFTHRFSTPEEKLTKRSADLILVLTAEERTRSRHRFTAATGEAVILDLPRGTVLRGGDCLTTPDYRRVVQIMAKPEPVLTVTATTSLALLRAAYHVGNRHVPLEITAIYLRLSADPVLAQMLQQLGLQVTAETAPFEPESGAYGHGHHS